MIYIITYEFIYLCLKILSNKISNEINYLEFVLNSLFTSENNYLKPVPEEKRLNILEI